MTIEQVIEYIRALDTSAQIIAKAAVKYRAALNQIRNIGIHESDSVLAATDMERIATEALEDIEPEEEL